MKFRSLIFVLLITALHFETISAVKYFVSSSSGNDSRDGRTEATAWKTLVKVNKKSFQPGDSIFLKRGDIWRETLKVPSSGTQQAFIFFTTYGSGSNPEILGSEPALKWTNQGGSLWKSDASFTDPYSVGRNGAEIFILEKNGSVSWGVNNKTTGECTSDYDWTYSSGKILIYSPTDPSERFASVEVPQRPNAVVLNENNFLRFDGIDLYFVAEAALAHGGKIIMSQKGLIIENCKIGYISVKDSEMGYGIDASYSDMIVRGCEIHDCGRRAISFHIYGRINLSNVLIENNYFHDGFHTTGPDFSVGSSGFYLSHINGVIIRRNTFFDPPHSHAKSDQIFIQNYRYIDPNSSISNIFIYSNIFISPSIASIQMEGSQSVFIYNNTFYNHNSERAESIAHVWVDRHNSHVEVKNNIFYSDLSSDKNGSGVELFVRDGQNPEKVDSDHNLYYRIKKSLRIVEKEYVDTYYTGDLPAISKKYGWEKNSPPPADPHFADPGKNNFELIAGSPAIGKGDNLNLPFDFLGKPFNAVKPSIGACEFYPQNSVIPSKKR